MQKIFSKTTPEDYTARFMTITYNVKSEFKKKLKNIIHKDNTIRVQVIDKFQNDLCYNILTQFYKKTGIPCLINTSFNIHEEPIVMDIEDGLRALDNNVVDLIVNEKEVLKNEKVDNLNQKIIEWEKKGEIKQNYFNPNKKFKVIIILSFVKGGKPSIMY